MRDLGATYEDDLRLIGKHVAYKIEQSVMGQKICFSDSYVIFGVRRKILIIYTIFRKKNCERNSLFLQCKTSIGNNSGSIKDGVLKFAYSMGLSAIAD